MEPLQVVLLALSLCALLGSIAAVLVANHHPPTRAVRRDLATLGDDVDTLRAELTKVRKMYNALNARYGREELQGDLELTPAKRRRGFDALDPHKQEGESDEAWLKRSKGLLARGLIRHAN